MTDRDYELIMKYIRNCRTDSYDVYIGRAPKGKPPSKWGNPFKLKSEADRSLVLRDYEKYLYSSGLINDIHELTGKTLGCFCVPESTE